MIQLAEIRLEDIYEQTRSALEDLFRDDPRDFRPIRLLVIGCSSSEIKGEHIGKGSDIDAACGQLRAKK